MNNCPARNFYGAAGRRAAEFLEAREVEQSEVRIYAEQLRVQVDQGGQLGMDGLAQMPGKQWIYYP